MTTPPFGSSASSRAPISPLVASDRGTCTDSTSVCLRSYETWIDSTRKRVSMLTRT